jgi:hypothetical protein
MKKPPNWEKLYNELLDSYVTAVREGAREARLILDAKEKAKLDAAAVDPERNMDPARHVDLLRLTLAEETHRAVRAERRVKELEGMATITERDRKYHEAAMREVAKIRAEKSALKAALENAAGRVRQVGAWLAEPAPAPTLLDIANDMDREARP